MNNKDYIMKRAEHKEYYDSIAQFKVGDRVLIVKSIPAHYKGWDNSWIATMDEYIGTEGIIRSLGNIERRNGLEISFRGSLLPSIYKFPPYSLKKIL